MIKLTELKRGQYTLRGIYQEATSPKAIVIMFHGYTGHLTEHNFMFKELANILEANHISSLRYDFMGSGMSDGTFDEMTFFTELEDAKAIFLDAKSKAPNLPVYVLGYSMGGAVASRLSTIFPQEIAKLILFSPAGNMDKIARSHFISVDPERLHGDLLDLGGFCVNRQFDLTLRNYDLYQDLDQFTNPVCIVHGEKDLSVPLEYGLKYASIYPHCEMHVISGGDHGYNSLALRKQANDIVLSFALK